MRFVFWPGESCPFHGLSLEERPLGGTETAIIRLAEALDELGHEVFVVTNFKNPPKTKPAYIPIKYLHQVGYADVFIIARGWREVFFLFQNRIRYKKCYFWTGDAFDNQHTYGIGDPRFYKNIDGLFPVSEWQAKTLCESSGFPWDKIFILRNGIKLAYFEGKEEKRHKRLIYSSTPYRGLIYLPEIYWELKRRHQDLELYVYSSMSIWSHQWPPSAGYDKDFQHTFEQLKSLPGCHVKNNILQKQLAREFMKSTILTYPSHFKESSCITAMEAQAGGCAIVTSHLAALPETVGDAGILITAPVGTAEYKDKFVEACDKILSDKELFQKLSKNGLERSRHFDWKSRAEELLLYLKEKHGLEA